MKRIAIISILVLLLDQITKFIIVIHMQLESRQAIDVFPPFLNFRMAWNQGINFGLFSNGSDIMRWVLVAIAISISVWLFFWGSRFVGWFGPLLVGLIIGGAIGNTLDRLIHGAVADFLNMSCCGLNNPYAFNVADISIFIGAFGLILFSDKLRTKP